MCCLSFCFKLSSAYFLLNTLYKTGFCFLLCSFSTKMTLFFTQSRLCSAHLTNEQPEQNQAWRRMPLLTWGSLPRALQDVRKNSCSSFCIAKRVLSRVWALEVYPESQNPLHVWRLMWFKQWYDLSRPRWGEGSVFCPSSLPWEMQ